MKGKAVGSAGNDTAAVRAKSRKKLWEQIRRRWVLYLFLAPAVVYIFLFSYVPMYGIQIGFKNYSMAKGFTGSEWVGFKWFEKFLSLPRFKQIVGNTLRLSIYDLIVGFPIPIILALILHNIKNVKWKKFAQTVTYMPHFISTVVIVSMISIFFSPRSGIINTILSFFGGSGDVYFMGSAGYFPHLYVWTGIWQGAGWGSILYLAALSGVDPTLHEAAEIDGANKIKRILHIDIPSIMPTIIIMLIMRCGSIMSVGYEKTFLMQNSLNITSSEVISTYTYKIGLQQQMYSYSTAIGLFNNVINFVFLTIVNKVAGKISGSSLW